MSRIWQSLAMLAAVMLAATPVCADDGWNPFRDRDELARRAKKPAEQPPATLPPMNDGYSGARPMADPATQGFGTAYPGSAAPPEYARPGLPPLSGNGREARNSSAVERLELEPTATVLLPGADAAKPGDVGPLPADAWRGLDLQSVEASVARTGIALQSATLHDLWTRLLTARIDPPQGGRTPLQFQAIRLDVLYRSGLLGAMGTSLEATPPDDPVFLMFSIRRSLALANREAACSEARKLIGRRTAVPKVMSGELHLIAGYCAAAEGNMGGAGVAADLAREEGVDAPVAIAALEALAGNGKGALSPPKQVSVLDYLLLELLGPVEPSQILDRAEPPLYTALALQQNADPRSRVLAAEAAARLHAIGAAELMAVYQSAPADAEDPTLRRAELVRLIAAEQLAPRKLKLMKSVVDDARRSGLLGPVARVLAPMLAGLTATADLAPYAETAVEIALAAGDVGRARDLAAAGAPHWLPLVDIAATGLSEDARERDLGVLDELVRRGRFPADVLHRLATVLDATDVNVPIPLWEAMNRQPQPASGYLPETGVLAQLQDAARRREIANTVLLVTRALGPDGPEAAHIIALGDAVRALRRVGLEREARALGVEALLRQWPRGSGS